MVPGRGKVGEVKADPNRVEVLGDARVTKGVTGAVVVGSATDTIGGG